MFATPRPKKSPLPPLTKKRKITSAVEEVSFDTDARQEYLSGFHKRKQQRIKVAQAEASNRARLEKLEARKQMREDRRRDVENHVETVNKLLRESNAVVDDASEDNSEEGGLQEWKGFSDQPGEDVIADEEEYIDENRYTTVTVDSVSISRDGFSKLTARDSSDHDTQLNVVVPTVDDLKKEPTRKPLKLRKKKFRYESKFDRNLTRKKEKLKRISRS